MTAEEIMKLAFAAHRANRGLGRNPSPDNDGLSLKADDALQAAITALVEERDGLRKAIKKNSVACIRSGIYGEHLWCIHCQCKLQLPSEAKFEHAPDCIVQRIENL